MNRGLPPEERAKRRMEVQCEHRILCRQRQVIDQRIEELEDILAIVFTEEGK